MRGAAKLGALIFLAALIALLIVAGVTNHRRIQLRAKSLWHSPLFRADITKTNGTEEDRKYWQFAFSSDGSTLATIGSDKSGSFLWLWDVPGAQLRSKSDLSSAEVDYLLFSGDGTTVVTVTLNESYPNGGTPPAVPVSVTRWDGLSGRKLSTVTIPSTPLWSAALSPDGLRLVVGSGDYWTRKNGKVSLWDLQSGALVAEAAFGSPSVTAVAYAPDGKSLAIGTGIPHAVDEVKSDVAILDATTLQPIVPALSHANSITFLAFSADGTTLASSDKDALVRFWDTQTWRMWSEVNVGDTVKSLAITPDGKIVATGFLYDVSLWNGRTGGEIGSFHVDLGCGGVNSLSFGGGGELLALVSERVAEFPKVIDVSTRREHKWKRARAIAPWMIYPLIALGILGLITFIMMIAQHRKGAGESSTWIEKRITVLGMNAKTLCRYMRT